MTLAVVIVAASPYTGAWVRRALETEGDIHVARGTTLADISPWRMRKADVLIVDDEMPLDIVHQLIRSSGGLLDGPGVVVVGVPPDHDRLTEYIEHGLRGYVLDSESPDVLIDVVRTVGSGAVRLDSWLAGSVVERYRQLRAQVDRAGRAGKDGHGAIFPIDLQP